MGSILIEYIKGPRAGNRARVGEKLAIAQITSGRAKRVEAEEPKKKSKKKAPPVEETPADVEEG